MIFDRQDVFDRALAHLRKQGKPALNPDHDGSFNSQACLYRTPDGLACAIGGLISDANYRPLLEGYPAAAAPVVSAMGYDPTALTTTDRNFLDALQRELHDDPARDLDYDFLDLVEEAAVEFAESWRLGQSKPPAST